MNYFKTCFIGVVVANTLCACAADADSNARLHLAKANRALEAGKYREAEHETRLAQRALARKLKKAEQESANAMRALQQLATQSNRDK
jgi:hypothetical protein